MMKISPKKTFNGLDAHASILQGHISRATRKLQKHGVQKCAHDAIDVGTALGAKLVAGVAKTGVDIAAAAIEVVPWAAHKSADNVRNLTRNASQAYQDYKNPAGADLASDVHRVRLQKNLQRTVKALERLNAQAPAVKLNWSQFGIHLGVMLPMKAAKLMLFAVVAKITAGLGHHMIANFLLPKEEAHLLAAAHLTSSTELALGLGAVHLLHDPFSQSLRNGNVAEAIMEQQRRKSLRNHYAKTLEILTDALASFGEPTAERTPKQLANIRRGLRRIEYIDTSATKITRADLRATLKDRRKSLKSLLASSAEPAVSGEVTEAAKREQKSFLRTHTGAVLSPKREARVKAYYAARAADAVERKSLIASRLATLKQAPTPEDRDLRNRMRARCRKLRVKLEMADNASRLANLMLDVRGANEKTQAALYLEYSRLANRQTLLTFAHEGYKALEQRSSSLVVPGEQGLMVGGPSAVTMCYTPAWYFASMTGMNWAALKLTDFRSQRRAMHAQARASIILSA